MLLISYNPLLPPHPPPPHNTSLSTLLPQKCIYVTVHFCPNTSLIETSVHHCPSTRPIDTLQSTTVPVPFILIHFCPSTSPTYSLLICHSPLLAKYQSCSYPTVNYCLNISLIDTIQYTTSPVLVLLINYSTLLPQY